MIDEFKYQYVPIGLPNVVQEYERDAQPAMGLHVDEFLWALIGRLAKVRPNWRFVSRGKYYNDRVTRLVIYEGHEELGWVRKAWSHNHGDRYEYDCRRMNDARQRGYATATKNVSKAFKDITKSFGAKTIMELLQEARSSVFQSAAAAVNRSVQEYTNYVASLRQPALTYALQNWETFRDFAAAQGTNANVLDNFHEVEAMHIEADKLAESRRNAYTVVMLRGSDYVMQREDGEVKIVQSDDLTPHMKRALGMLKLADNGTFIPGMGVRGNQSAFYILDE